MKKSVVLLREAAATLNDKKEEQVWGLLETLFNNTALSQPPDRPIPGSGTAIHHGASGTRDN